MSVLLCLICSQIHLKVERYRRIQAEQEAKNIGAVIGLVAGVAMVLTQDEQSSTEQQWTEDQQAEQTQQQTM